MRITLAYNVKVDDSEAYQEFDSPHHIEALMAGLRRHGHRVTGCEVSGAVASWLPRLLRQKPDLVFNIAEGHRGRMREALFPMIFDAYGLRYTHSDAYVLGLTLDKWLTKATLKEHGVIDNALCGSPAGGLFGVHKLDGRKRYIVKPNFEGSSKGISDDGVGTLKEVTPAAKRLLKRFPEGVLAEEFIPGRDITVPWVEGIGALSALRTRPWGKHGHSRHTIYTSKQKAGMGYRFMEHVAIDCQYARQATEHIVKALGIRDIARIDFRLDDEGYLWFLEVNPLPSLEFHAGFAGEINTACVAAGIVYEDVLKLIVQNASERSR